MTMYTYLLSEFKSTYYTMIPLSIILQSCIGSIAAMYILVDHTRSTAMLELIICVVTCMFYNAAVLAQLRVKWVFNLLLLSIVINVLLIIINLL